MDCLFNGVLLHGCDKAPKKDVLNLINGKFCLYCGKSFYELKKKLEKETVEKNK